MLKYKQHGSSYCISVSVIKPVFWLMLIPQIM